MYFQDKEAFLEDKVELRYVNNYDNNNQGQEDALVSPVLDFTGRTNTNLDIEYAYARYNNNNKDCK